MIQQYLVKINELTQNLSPVLPEKVKSNILLYLLDLQHQIDSTAILANNSFVQMSSRIKENNRMDVSYYYYYLFLLIHTYFFNAGIYICSAIGHWQFLPF